VKHRETIRDFERDALVDALRAGKKWEEAKALLPDVDSAALDAGFKAFCHEQAGLELAEPEAEDDGTPDDPPRFEESGEAAPAAPAAPAKSRKPRASKAKTTPTS
jgi:hypothetical protein